MRHYDMELLIKSLQRDVAALERSVQALARDVSEVQLRVKHLEVESYIVGLLLIVVMALGFWFLWDTIQALKPVVLTLGWESSTMPDTL